MFLRGREYPFAPVCHLRREFGCWKGLRFLPAIFILSSLSCWRPLNTEICGCRLDRRISKGQWIDWSVGKRQKGKPASLWLVKSNTEIKACTAELFGRNVTLNTQEEVHKHLRGNIAIFLFCFVLFCCCMPATQMSVLDKRWAEMIHIAFQKGGC